MFHKRTKTRTEVIEEQLVVSRVIKLTYLQSLALEGSLFNANEAFTSEAVDEYQELNQYDQSESNRQGEDAKNFLQNAANGLYAGGDVIGGFLVDQIGEFAESIGDLFGREETKTTKVETKQTGFQISKIWNQPQFDVIRYAIGIKDINVAQFRYATTSEIISKPFRSPKEIVKVVCRASQFVPSIFPVGNYIEYYIKPNQENTTWTRINPLDFATVFDDQGKIIPRVVNFNTEEPLQSRLEESYILTDEPVKEVVFKAILKRPETLENTTVSADGYSPVLKSYRLLMTPKNGL